jgi:Flp pilus assembly protein TadD
MDSNRVSARLGAAGAYYTRTDLPNADTMIQSVLVRDPENAQALGLQGIILFAKKDYVKAHEVVNKAIELSPKPDAQLYNYQGIIAHKRKRIGEAIKALEKAVELQPNHSEARFNLAVLYATKKPKDLEKAITHYELALKLGSRRDQALEKILYP